MPRAGARDQNLVHLQNVVFQLQIFLEVYILTTTDKVKTVDFQKLLEPVT